MTDAQYAAVLEAVYPEMDGWLEREESPSLDPRAGSDLEGDNAVFPYHQLSEISRLSLSSASDHLRMARCAIDTRELFPFAHFTALRAALLASCQAVWILGEDNPSVRRERALTVIHEMYAQALKYWNFEASIATDGSDAKQLADEQADFFTSRRDAARLAGGKTSLNTTDFIGTALDITFDDPNQRILGRVFWRQHSSDAHSLFWSALQRGTLEPIGETGVGIGQVGGSIEPIADSFMCSVMLVRKGWALFDARFNP